MTVVYVYNFSFCFLHFCPSGC